MSDPRLKRVPSFRAAPIVSQKSNRMRLSPSMAGELGIPYVIVRPGYVYGPGNEAITGRVGIDTFGAFLHLGGANTIPFTYVDNCADAIALAGLTRGVDGEVFNVLDDDLPSSRRFLRLYKRNVKKFRSLYVPHAVSYMLCYFWERYSAWSKGQLTSRLQPQKMVQRLEEDSLQQRKAEDTTSWKPGVPISEGLERYFEACRRRGPHA